MATDFEYDFVSPAECPVFTPTMEEYKKITKLYEEALQAKINPPKKESISPKKEKTALKKDLAEEGQEVGY